MPTDPLEERIVPDLKGYRGDGPVRIGNAAVAQNQHDTYGSVDPRGDADVLRPAPAAHGRRELCSAGWSRSARWPSKLAFEPDAGIWEYRGRKRIHTHSAAMCWAGCQRLEAIAAHLGLDDRAAYWGEHAADDPWRDAGEGLESEARRLHGGVRLATISTPACCCCPSSALIEADRSALRLHRQRDRARTQARPSRHAL